MANPRTPKDNQEKNFQDKMRKRLTGLFSGGEEPPTYMSISQVESLKARLAELETTLGQQPAAVDKVVQEPHDMDSPALIAQPNLSEPGVTSPTGKLGQRFPVKLTGLLDRLSYPRKFIVISLLFLLPLLVFYPLVNEQLQRIENYGYQEKRGTDYLYTLYHLLNNVQAYQLEADKFASGEVSATDLKAREAEVNLSLQELTQVHARNGVALGLSNEPSQLSTEWETIKSGMAQQQATGPQQAKLITEIQGLIFKIGNNSYLILDPDLGTYYTMDAMLLRLPENQALLYQILALNDKAASAHRLTPEQSAQLTVLVGRLRTNLDSMNTNIGVAMQNDNSGQMRPLVGSALSAYSGMTSDFLSKVDRQLITATNISADTGNLSIDGQQLMAAQETLFDRISQALQIGIQWRINALTNRLILALSLALFIAFVAFFIGLSVMRAISVPLQSLTLAAQRLATGDMAARAKVLSGDEVGQTAAAFNAMAERLRQTLTTLTIRTRDLTLAAEVGQRISEVRDIGGLLKDAMELIQNRFDLYYAQVYLLDDAGQNLILRAGTGEVGQELLRRGFYLPLNTASLNGTAIVEKRAVIVSDTDQSAYFRPNPLLPDTRSEMCIPLLAGDRVMGVLDLQSVRPGTFSKENLPVFNALVGQLAIAIQNATLFAEAEQARSEVESQVRRLTKQGWQDFLDAIDRGESMGFAFDQSNIVRLEGESITTAASEGYSVPISVTGTKIGAIEFAQEPNRTWTNSESELIEGAATQLAQHIENLRLLAQAEKYRAEAEQAVRRLTREGWDTYLQPGSQETAGFKYDLNEVSLLNEGENDNQTPVKHQALKVRDEVIGELSVHDSNNSQEDTNELISAVATQLSSHIENLRLSLSNMSLLKSTEERAQREQTLRQITVALRSSTNPATIMRTAVRELGSILGRKTIVQLSNPERPNQAESVISSENEPDSSANQS